MDPDSEKPALPVVDRKPTNESYDSMVLAYDFFNKQLFGGTLPTVMITYQRGKYAGFAAKDRWMTSSGERVHELAMNPSFFANSPVEEVLSTLLHEAVHIQQFEVGKPGRRGYHNKEFARLMADIGLICSHDGMPDGKQTGEKMTHYFLWDALAWKAVRALIDKHDYTIPWLDRQVEGGAAPLLLFDAELRPRSIGGKVLGEPFDREGWNEKQREAKEPPLPKEEDYDPEDPPPAPAGKGLEAELVVTSPGRGGKKPKPYYACPRKGCEVRVHAKEGLEIGCFCPDRGGQFVYETGIPEDDEFDDAVTAEPESPGQPDQQTDPAPVMLLLPAPAPEGPVAELD